MVFQMPHRRQCFEKKFAEMKNAIIFVPSNISISRRGRKMLVPHKAGIFRFHEKKAIYTCRAEAIMATATRAERLVFDSGKGKSLFCLPALNVKHNDSTTISILARQDRGTAIRIQRQPGSSETAAHTAKRPGNSLKRQGAITEARNAFQVVINQINTFFHSFQPSCAAAGLTSINL